MRLMKHTVIAGFCAVAALLATNSAFAQQVDGWVDNKYTSCDTRTGICPGPHGPPLSYQGWGCATPAGQRNVQVLQQNFVGAYVDITTAVYPESRTDVTAAGYCNGDSNVGFSINAAPMLDQPQVFIIRFNGQTLGGVR